MKFCGSTAQRADLSADGGERDCGRLEGKFDCALGGRRLIAAQRSRSAENVPRGTIIPWSDSLYCVPRKMFHVEHLISDPTPWRSEMPSRATATNAVWSRASPTRRRFCHIAKMFHVEHFPQNGFAGRVASANPIEPSQ